MLEHELFERRLSEALRGYAAEAPTHVESFALARSIVAAHPRHARLSWAPRVRRAPALAICVVTALLLLATAIAIVAIGSALQKDTTIVSPDAPGLVEDGGLGGFSSPVVAEDGLVYAVGLQGLSVYHPSSGNSRVYGPRDDAIFAYAQILGAAPGHGVWLRADERLILFDDGQLKESLAVPASVCGFARDPDLVMLHCDDDVARPGAPLRSVTLAGGPPPGFATVDGSGGAIYGFARAAGLLWQLEDGSWIQRPYPGRLDIREPVATTTGSDGSFWVAVGHGLVHFDGQSWQESSPGRAGEIASLAVAADGTLWGAGWGSADGPVAFSYEGNAFTTYALPIAPSPRPMLAPGIAMGTSDVFATGSGALYRLVDDAFQLIDGGPPTAGPIQGVSGHPDQSVAVDTSGRIWIADETELGRFVGDTYEMSTQEPSGPLVSAPDGSVWMGGPVGPLKLTGEEFELVGPPLEQTPELPFRHQVPPFAVSPHGIPYTLIGTGPCETAVRSCQSQDERVVRLVDGSWQELPPHQGIEGGVAILAVAPDGAVWVATGRNDREPTIARYVDGQWELMPLPPGPLSGVRSIAFAPDGAIWFSFLREPDRTPGGCPGSCFLLGAGRLDGDEWTVFDWAEENSPISAVAVQGLLFGDIVVSPDSTAWLSSKAGTLRLVGDDWDWALRMYGLSRLTVAPDGSVWAAGTGLHRLTEP